MATKKFIKPRATGPVAMTRCANAIGKILRPQKFFSAIANFPAASVVFIHQAEYRVSRCP